MVMQLFMYAIRQEAAGALWNLSFNDRNREAIAVAGGVEALVNPSFPVTFPAHFRPLGDNYCFVVYLNTSSGPKYKSVGTAT
jgi:hypothetical protein